MLYSSSKTWFAARTRRNQERLIKTQLEQMGVEHFIPFREVLCCRRGRNVKCQVPVIPNVVFIHADYRTSLSIVNEYGVKIWYMKSIDGKGPLVVPPKQLDDFRCICENNVKYTITQAFAKGDRVQVVRGVLAGLEGELTGCPRHNGRIIVRLDGIAAFELAISAGNLKKI